jgi:alginate O-acetyltransferase complex protein AlgI
MIFNTPWFLGFFAIFYCLLWLLPGRMLRLYFLLASSAVFHAHFAGPAGVLPIIAMAVITYFLGLKLEDAAPEAKGAWLLLGLVVPVAGLAFYKYRVFILNNLMALLPSSQALLQPWAHAAAMPLAISFFTFEFVHYLTEIYRGHAASRQPLRFALFCIYFPSIVSGPIKRFADFDGQSRQGLPHPWENPLAAQGLAQVLLGFFKKMVVADNAVTLIQVLDNRDHWNPSSSLALIALQSLRILCDFSGYSDIAIGLAKIIGLRVPPNFNFPYLASNIQDFWRRWHMSLSSWIRDYVYIPLGGSRQGDLRKGINVIVAMGLCGLWHGAAWNFVVWGAYHGLGMAVHGWWAGRGAGPSTAASPRSGQALRLPSRFVTFSAWFTTLVFVCYGWLLFFYPLAKVAEISRGLWAF